MRSTKRSDKPRTYQDGDWFFGEPIAAMSDAQGNEVHAVPIGLTAFGPMPLLILAPTGPLGGFYLYRNGREVPDFREKFIEHLDNWLVSIGLPPGDHRLDIWTYWQFEGRPSGRSEREALSAFYDRVAKHGPPPPSPKWSDPGMEDLTANMRRKAGARTADPTWSRHPDPSVHRPARGGTQLTLVETHSGRISHSPEGEVSFETMSGLVPHLTEMLNKGESPIPGYPEYTLLGTSDRNCLMGAVCHMGKPVLMFFVAVSNRTGRWLWDAAHKDAHAMVTRGTSAPPVPWCALRIETPELAPAVAEWVGDYAIIAAWSWVERHRRNKADRKRKHSVH